MSAARLLADTWNWLNMPGKAWIRAFCPAMSSAGLLADTLGLDPRVRYRLPYKTRQI